MAQALRLGANGLAVRRLGSALLGRGIHDPKAWGSAFQVPRLLSDAIGTLPRLAPDGEVTSPVDGFQKLRFRTHDGLAVETVLIPLHKPGAVSVCLSSQVGCAMGCVFCATARMTARRNLAAWEILDQWVQARDLARSQGRRVTGVVFMGMGEPFLNYERVRTAARVALLPLRRRGGRPGPSPISTVGLVPEIDRFTAEGHKFRLSISLGAATDAKRGRLVPIAVADARSPRSWPPPAAMPRRAAIASCSPTSASGARTSARTTPGRSGALIGDTPVRFDLIDVTDPIGPVRAPDRPRDGRIPRRPEPPPRPAGRQAILGRQGHPGRLRDPRGRRLEQHGDSCGPRHHRPSERPS